MSLWYEPGSIWPGSWMTYLTTTAGLGWGTPSENEASLLEKRKCFPVIALDHFIMPCPKPVLPMDFLANYSINFPYLLKPFQSVFLITHRVQVESPSITKMKSPTSRKSSCWYDSFKGYCLYQPIIKKYHGKQKPKTQWGSRISF